MRIRFLLLLGLCILLLGGETLAQTQLEMNEAACAEYQTVDDRLNQLYRAIMEKYKGDPLTAGKIREAERAWLKYRDAELEAMYPHTHSPEAHLHYGSMQPLCRCAALTALTLARIKRLEAFLPAEDGHVCSPH